MMKSHNSAFFHATRLTPLSKRLDWSLDWKKALSMSLLACALQMTACTSMNIGDRATIDDDAGAILKKMSDKLASAKQFSVNGSRNVDPALLPSRKLNRSSKIEAAIIRPNKIAASSTSDGLTRRFIYDGHDVTLYDLEMNHYATVRGASTIDRTVDKIIKDWDFHPPMADLLVSNPYRSLTQGALSGRTNGTQWIGGVKCQRVAVSKETLDWEIWIANSDQLPRKLEITFKNESGSPKVQLLFKRWNLNPKLEGSQFTFEPPKDAVEIEMVPAS